MDEKVGRLISSYIEVCQDDFYDDAQIIDTLAGIFTREELETLGFGEFVRDYFEDGEG